MAAYLREWRDERHCANWHAGFNSCPIGCGTYASNSEERMWGILETAIPRMGSMDATEVMQEVCRVFKGWSEGERFADVQPLIDRPLPLFDIGPNLVSERTEDGTQHRRLTVRPRVKRTSKFGMTRHDVDTGVFEYALP